MKTNRAQVKFGETIGVLIIFYFVLMFGLMWFNSSNSDDLEEIKQKDRAERAFEKYYFVLHSSLLHKSEGGISDRNFDYHAMRAFEQYSKTEQGKDFLFEELGYAIIHVDIYEPDQLMNLQNDLIDNLETLKTNGNYESLTIYNYTSDTRSYRKKESFNSLIPIENVIDGGVRIGVLMVEIPFYE